jgi:hypothetical protein
MEKLAEKAALEGDSVIDYLRMCRSTLVAQMAAMNDAGDARGAAYVAVQLTKVLETMAKVTGELGVLAQTSTFNISNVTNVAILEQHPIFMRMQASMLRALGPFPEARNAVVAALATSTRKTHHEPRLEFLARFLAPSSNTSPSHEHSQARSHR